MHSRNGSSGATGLPKGEAPLAQGKLPSAAGERFDQDTFPCPRSGFPLAPAGSLSLSAQRTSPVF